MKKTYHATVLVRHARKQGLHDQYALYELNYHNFVKKFESSAFTFATVLQVHVNALLGKCMQIVRIQKLAEKNITVAFPNRCWRCSVRRKRYHTLKP